MMAMMLPTGSYSVLVSWFLASVTKTWLFNASYLYRVLLFSASVVLMMLPTASYSMDVLRVAAP
jgi:hypothetical protein